METWEYSLGYYLWGCKQYLGANLVSLIANGKSIREMDGGEKKLKRKKKTKDIVGKGKILNLIIQGSGVEYSITMNEYWGSIYLKKIKMLGDGD